MMLKICAHLRINPRREIRSWLWTVSEMGEKV